MAPIIAVGAGRGSAHWVVGATVGDVDGFSWVVDGSLGRCGCRGAGRGAGRRGRGWRLRGRAGRGERASYRLLDPGVIRVAREELVGGHERDGPDAVLLDLQAEVDQRGQQRPGDVGAHDVLAGLGEAEVPPYQ